MTYGMLEYEKKSESQLEIVRCDPSAFGILEIPSMIDNIPITSIADKAFLGCSHLTFVVLPDTVEVIGVSAFEGCHNLIFIHLPEGLSRICKYAFCKCESLYAISFPNSLEEIEDFAFCGCKQLTSVKVSSSLKKVGFSAFSMCTALKTVELGKVYLEIGEGVFSGCSSLTSVKMLADLDPGLSFDEEDKLKILNAMTFAYCTALPSVSIPPNVTTILAYAFGFCEKLKHVVFYGPPPFTYIRSFEMPVGYYDKAYTKEWEKSIAEGKWTNIKLVALDVAALHQYGTAIEDLLKTSKDTSKNESLETKIYPLSFRFAGTVLSAYLKGTTEPSYRDYLILLAECAKRYDCHCWQYLKTITTSIWHIARLIVPIQVPWFSDLDVSDNVVNEVDALVFPSFPVIPKNREEYRALGRTFSDAIVNTVIESLKNMESDCGPDYDLDAWEAFCVQCQGDQAFSWDAYVETIEQIIYEELKKYDSREIKILKTFLWVDDEAEDYDGDTLEKSLLDEVMEIGGWYENDAIDRVLYHLNDEDEDSYDDEDDEETDEAFESDDNDEEDEESESLTQEVAMPSPTFNLKVSSEFEAAVDELADVLDEIAKRKSQEHD